jgi:hypothetical protein
MVYWTVRAPTRGWAPPSHAKRHDRVAAALAALAMTRLWSYPIVHGDRLDGEAAGARSSMSGAENRHSFAFTVSIRHTRGRSVRAHTAACVRAITACEAIRLEDRVIDAEVTR